MHREHELLHEDEEYDDENQDQEHSLSGEGRVSRGHGHGSLHNHGPVIDSEDLALDFSKQLHSCVHHYFVTTNAADPKVVRELGGLDPNVDAPTSNTRFFTLPTMRKQWYMKIIDPIFNFAQAKILTSNKYTIVAKELKMAKEMVEREKEQQRRNKQNLRRRKEWEQEEERSAKVVARKEAAYLKELWATKQAELQARHQAVCEEAQRIQA